MWIIIKNLGLGLKPHSSEQQEENAVAKPAACPSLAINKKGSFCSSPASRHKISASMYAVCIYADHGPMPFSLFPVGKCLYLSINIFHLHDMDINSVLFPVCMKRQEGKSLLGCPVFSSLQQ